MGAMRPDWFYGILCQINQRQPVTYVSSRGCFNSWLGFVDGSQMSMDHSVFHNEQTRKREVSLHRPVKRRFVSATFFAFPFKWISGINTAFAAS